MKRIAYIMMAALAMNLCIVSCNKDDKEEGREKEREEKEEREEGNYGISNIYIPDSLFH